MKLLTLLLSLTLSQAAFAKEITLTTDNHVVLDDQFDDLTTAQVIQQAQLLDSKLPSGDSIYLVLNSPGGSIQAGLDMIEALNSLNRKVSTITIFSASMGFQAVQGLGTRYILPNGTLMAHKARGSLSGEFPGQLDSRYALWLKRIDTMDRKAVERSKGKLTLDKFRAMYENEWWADGQDAVNVGLADEVSTVKCEQALAQKSRNQAFDFFGFTIILVKSGCPTNTGILDVKVMIHTNQGLISLQDFLAKGGSFDPAPDSSSYYYGPKALSSIVKIDMNEINKRVEEVKRGAAKRREVIRGY